MNSSLLYSVARRMSLTLMLGAVSAAAFAIPVMDMHIEDMLPMGPDFKTELKLNANQSILWQQVEAKSRALVRERRGRRERLEAALKQQLGNPKVELRDLVGGLDAETATSAAEEKQLREWWLEVNDALNETQRQAVATFFAEQMLRKMDGGPAGGGGGAPAKGEGGRGGGHGGRGGMGGGMGGGGVGVGPGGMNVSLPTE